MQTFINSLYSIFYNLKIQLTVAFLWLFNICIYLLMYSK